MGDYIVDLKGGWKIWAVLGVKLKSSTETLVNFLIL